jgi:hypothetical protein
MTINKIISKLMRENGVTQQVMAVSIGKKKATDISSRLHYNNMTFARAIEMLDVLGYEVVIQKKTAGERASDQIVVTATNES